MTREEFQFSQVIVTLFIMIYMSGSGRVCCKTDPIDPYRQPAPNNPTKREPKQRKSAKWGKTVLFYIPETIPIILHRIQSVPFKARAFPTYFPNTTLLSDPVSWPIFGLQCCEHHALLSVLLFWQQTTPSFCVQIFPQALTRTSKCQSNKTRSRVTIWQILY